MITILTPTYNRAHTLTRLFESLLEQTNQKFEWVVVDDGSTDSTHDLIEKFIHSSCLNIKYIYQDNQGKPSAVNKGVENSLGDYIFIVDSDDFLTKDCVEILQEKILLHIKNNNIFSGLCFRKGRVDGSILGEELINTFEDDYSYYHSTELKNMLNVDLAYCFNRKYMEENKFPYFVGEKFVPELYIWNKITDSAKVYAYLHKVLYLCEYLPDGLTANFNQQLKNNPKGFFLYYNDQFFREQIVFNKIKMFIRVVQCFFYKLVK